MRLITARDSNGKYFLSLDLSPYTGITDVSALGEVHALCLIGCTDITDVLVMDVLSHDSFQFLSVTEISPLRGERTLDVSFCHGITDVIASSIHLYFMVSQSWMYYFIISF